MSDDPKSAPSALAEILTDEAMNHIYQETEYSCAEGRIALLALVQPAFDALQREQAELQQRVKQETEASRRVLVMNFDAIIARETQQRVVAWRERDNAEASRDDLTRRVQEITAQWSRWREASEPDDQQQAITQLGRTIMAAHGLLSALPSATTPGH